MELKEHGLFHTPENIDDVWNWIEKHNAEDKMHLYTAVMMFNNFIAKNYTLEKKG